MRWIQLASIFDHLLRIRPELHFCILIWWRITLVLHLCILVSCSFSKQCLIDSDELWVSELYTETWIMKLWFKSIENVALQMDFKITNMFYNNCIMGTDNTINHLFHATVLFLHPWKPLESIWFSGDFRGTERSQSREMG